MRRRAECGGGKIQAIHVILGNCGRSRTFGVWKNGCITLIHGETKVVLYYNEDTKNLEVRYFANSNNNVYSGAPHKYTFSEFNIDIFKTILRHLINSTDTNFTNDDLIDLIERINTESTRCGDLHCSMVINFLKKLLQKEEQNNKKPINILSQQIKNQKEKKMRNELQFKRLAEEARLAKAEQGQLNSIQYRRRLLASLPSATTEKPLKTT